MKKTGGPFFNPVDLVATPRGPHPSLRTRLVCMSRADWQALGDALQRVYPIGRYLRELRRDEEKSDTYPEWYATDHLLGYVSPAGALPSDLAMILDPDWKMEILRDSDSGKWIAPQWRFPFIRFRPGPGIQAADSLFPERISSGEIWVYCEMKNREHHSFARRFFRLFEQFATNKMQYVINYRSGEKIGKTLLKSGSSMWLGHDAMRWVHEDPARVLFDDTNDFGYRPVSGEQDE